MNIHPIFVHFPVALLTLYSVLELVRFKKITSQPYWFYVKAVLVIFGSASTTITIFTGEMAGDLVKGIDPGVARLIEQHEFFAWTSAIIFAIIALAYLVTWINRQRLVPFTNSIWLFFSRLSRSVIETPVVLVLALLGLLSITITAGLGGRLAYGDIDPAFTWFYKMFLQ